MSIYNDWTFIRKVIKTCNNLDQLDSAGNMVQNFINTYEIMEETEEHDYLDELNKATQERGEELCRNVERKIGFKV